MTQQPVFTESPLQTVRQTGEPMRRRLTGPQAVLDYPVLEDLQNEGMTDYLALPFQFNAGLVRHSGESDRIDPSTRPWSIGFATYCTDHPGGFTDDQVTILNDMTLVVARLAENLAAQAQAARFLDIYVGPNAGARILDGQVMRGSGESINAALWFCDLRGFTRMSDRLPRDSLIELLNAYFDCMGQAVTAHGGEILKFIGDAMLAIFAVNEGQTRRAACAQALVAAGEAVAAATEINAERRKNAREPFDFGIALHVGDVMYGNIGTSSRLDFTVIGPAVNLVNRLQTLCRDLNRQVLVSENFADLVDQNHLVPCGRHQLSGIATPQAVFAPARLSTSADVSDRR